MLTGSLALLLVLVLAFLRIPIGFALLLVGVGGFAMERGWRWNAALSMAGNEVYDVSANYSLSVIPLFILMGAFIHRAQLSKDLYDAANAFVGHRRGGLAMGTVAACGGFAAVSGSSLATAATMARVAVPSMRRFGYADSLSTGAIAAGGTLGILIPPSVPLVIYGILSETDIGQLFMAGVVPGLILIGLFMAAIAFQTWLNPDLGPRAPKLAWSERLHLLWRVWGVLLIFILIIGGIYTGWFTPTAASGVGAFGAFLFALSRRKLNFRTTFQSLVEAARTTGMIFVVTFGALVFENFLGICGFTSEIGAWIAGIDAPVIVILLAICAVYLVLGCVFDSLAMLFLTVPVFVPVMQMLGIDLVWFGIIVIIVVELGLISPPIGMNVFVVKAAIGNVSVWTIFKGVWPFVVAMLLAVALVIAIPSLATWLPSAMLGGS